jgi:hypothetical protein
MKLKQILNVVAFLTTFVVNGLASGLALNGQTTGDVSDSIPTLFTPAGYVFAIWAVIYLGLAVYAVYQALPRQRSRDVVERVGYWFAVSCAFNIAWLFAWHYEVFPLSMVMMLGLLGSLIATYERLRVGRDAAPVRERIFVHLPFSVYLAWISVATIANFSVVFYTLGWDGGGAVSVIVSALLVIVAAGLGVAMIFQRSEIAYPLVLVWALIGIAVARADEPVIAAVALLSVLGLLAVLLRNRLNMRARAG